MKYIHQFAVLVAVCFVGEILHYIIPLPVPASIYGLVLMFCALQCKLLPLSAVEETSDYMLEIMPLLFVPSTVGLMVAWPVLKLHWLQFLIIGIVGTTFVFFAAGHVTQLVIRITNRSNRKRQNAEHRPAQGTELHGTASPETAKNQGRAKK